MVDVSIFTQAQRQQHAVMLLQNYHELCSTIYPSSMFVSPPPITNIESFSQSTISSMDSGSFGRNRADVNIQQQYTMKVSNTETVMADNEELDPPPPQNILNVFAAADWLSCSLSDSAKHKLSWIKAKVICYSILSSREYPDACSTSLPIALNHK